MLIQKDKSRKLFTLQYQKRLIEQWLAFILKNGCAQFERVHNFRLAPVLGSEQRTND
jgi:hypothetical protein